MERNIAKPHTTFQHRQIDFLTSHVIKVKDGGYRLFMLMDCLPGLENQLCSLDQGLFFMGGGLNIE